MVQGLSNHEMSERLFLALVLLKGTIGISLASSRSKGALKRSHVPASWVCCSLARKPGISTYQYSHNNTPNTTLVSLCSYHREAILLVEDTRLVHEASGTDGSDRPQQGQGNVKRNQLGK